MVANEYYSQATDTDLVNRVSIKILIIKPYYYSSLLGWAIYLIL